MIMEASLFRISIRRQVMRGKLISMDIWTGNFPKKISWTLCSITESEEFFTAHTR
jgi:hypothetical protein